MSDETVSGNGKKNGRPRKELPGDDATIADAYDQLETMAGYGLTRKMMASILGVSHDTLQRRVAEDGELLRRLEKGEALAAAQVAQNVYELATGKIVVQDEKGRIYKLPPNLGACIWFEKTRGARSERFKIEDEREDLQQIPLSTLRQAVRDAVKREPRLLDFPKRKREA